MSEMGEGWGGGRIIVSFQAKGVSLRGNECLSQGVCVRGMLRAEQEEVQTRGN